MYESDDEQSKREFYHHESNNNKNNNIENDDSMSYCLKKPYNKSLINLDWSLRENIRPRSFMYRPRFAGSVRC